MIKSSSRFDFTESVQELLQYAQVSAQFSLDEVIREVARESRGKLRKASPGKKYPKGWAVDYETGRFRVGATVYGKSGTYQLAHLLEYGHATRNGGRTKAIVHIEPVEQWAINEVQERFVRKMEEQL